MESVSEKFDKIGRMGSHLRTIAQVRCSAELRLFWLAFAEM
jgi:hypothetical protein